ncbi:MAG: hypothetical protein EHM88_06545 [Candidatus Rokuibacteriota bacterium]|nr:MAG: hypothetical protein EHM88_06545 [Candidatus Rokubacteria bacterium]
MDVTLGGVPVTLEQLPGGAWRGSVKVGPIVLTAACDGEVLRRLVSVEMRRRGGGAAAVAGRLSRVDRVTQRVVAAKVGRQLGPVARSLASHEVLVGQLADRGCQRLSVSDIRAAARLVGRAKNGDMRAKAAVARVALAAQAGDPAACAAAHALRCAAGLAAQVGGPVWDWVRSNWGYHRGVRPDEQQYSARDAYRGGGQGYAARAAAAAARRR